MKTVPLDPVKVHPQFARCHGVVSFMLRNLSDPLPMPDISGFRAWGSTRAGTENNTKKAEAGSPPMLPGPCGVVLP